MPLFTEQFQSLKPFPLSSRRIQARDRPSRGRGREAPQKRPAARRYTHHRDTSPRQRQPPATAQPLGHRRQIQQLLAQRKVFSLSTGRQPAPAAATVVRQASAGEQQRRQWANKPDQRRQRAEAHLRPHRLQARGPEHQGNRQQCPQGARHPHRQLAR